MGTGSPEGYSKLLKAIRYTEIARGSVTHLSLTVNSLKVKAYFEGSFGGFWGKCRSSPVETLKSTVVSHHTDTPNVQAPHWTPN